MTGRTIIPHLDDVGMCHGANVALDELSRDGFVTCASLMVPCPWFREATALAANRPDLDLGVHLTLTSEWPHYRWGPISTVSRSSGLIDGQGCFWSTCDALRRHVVPESAEVEMRCQIDRAIEAGIDVTHLDAHMGAALIPELLDAYVRVAEAYRLPVLLPRAIDEYVHLFVAPGAIDLGPYHDAVRRVAAFGGVMVDQFRSATGSLRGQPLESYRALVRSLPAGLTYLALHCNAPGDFETISGARAPPHRRVPDAPRSGVRRLDSCGGRCGHGHAAAS
jgi:predicted glycoside hydrolase/deacetylase ChbG (UPF0249 family)